MTWGFERFARRNEAASIRSLVARNAFTQLVAMLVIRVKDAPDFNGSLELTRAVPDRQAGR
jgi:hypothetical protein